MNPDILHGTTRHKIQTAYYTQYLYISICSELNITSPFYFVQNSTLDLVDLWKMGYFYFKIYLVPTPPGTRPSLFIYKYCMCSHCPTLPYLLEAVISAQCDHRIWALDSKKCLIK